MARSMLAFSQVRFDFRIGSLFSSLCSLVVCFRDFPFVLWWIRRVGWWWFGSERILADFGEADSSVVDRFLVVTHTEAPLLRRADPLAPLLLFLFFYFFGLMIGKICGLNCFLGEKYSACQCDDELRKGWGSGGLFSHREPSNQKTTSLSTEHCFLQNIALVFSV